MQTSVSIAVDRAKALLDPKDVGPALRAAVSRTVTTFIARSSRAVAQTLNLRIGDIKDQYSVKNASTKDPQAEVSVRRKPIKLYEYLSNAQAVRGLRRPPGGIRVRVRRGGALEQHVHSFIAVMKTGHIGVFHRGDKRFSVPGAKSTPIYEEQAETAIGALGNAPDEDTSKGTIFEASCDFAAGVLIKNIDQQVGRFLAKYAAE